MRTLVVRVQIEQKLIVKSTYHVLVFCRQACCVCAALIVSGVEGGAGWFNLEKIHLLCQEDGASRHREGALLTECQSYFFWRSYVKATGGVWSRHETPCLLFASGWLVVVLLLIVPYLGTIGMILQIGEDASLSSQNVCT